MSCRYSQHTIDETIKFHGHSCPGLAIGIRAAEYCGIKYPQTEQSSLLCLSETDMCGVDAIQFLTGCTYGKGNLIHRDYGKMAFSFFDRQQDSGFRIIFKKESRGERQDELEILMAKNSTGSLETAGKKRLSTLREELQQRLMTLPLEDLFDETKLTTSPPRPARILQSLQCQQCLEDTMESRTRRFAGQTLCIPCYNDVEQKV